MSKIKRRPVAVAAACVKTRPTPPRVAGLSGIEAIIVIVLMLIAVVLVVIGVSVTTVLELVGGIAVISVGIIVSVRKNRYLRLASLEA
ncbi:hypothetical protein ACFWOG_20530 [Kitasatospora sp. NPDC058406]|uniref:hypothetical protein n=1 Tax=Kitasatospora sp. NPDC058406 TaxID=3346483 RepID=UPI0036631169